MLILKTGNKMIDHYTRFKENEDYLSRELQLYGKRHHVLMCAVLIMDVIMCSKDVHCNNKEKT